ncbi:zinc finger CCCH domain-containing protein 13 isoform X1 [Danio aesculapii]|uniref:zinc finger CCCH domain-containing protein 13 isoform X1 n=1 Tax=Danio aesculapii TaxID=1142201 RepID=UPI0024BF8D5F|nr:zinc finger CCCH domain-containing protein 13 isoform X1 [Danio aesculapii]
MDRERAMMQDSCDGTRERDRLPAIRRREIDWRERERRRDGDQYANGKSSLFEHTVHGERDKESKKGDTFPRMTKANRERDRRIPLSENERERRMERSKDTTYEDERERERRIRDMDTQNERERALNRVEWRINDTRRRMKEHSDRLREQELDLGMRERRREGQTGANDLTGMREKETDRERERYRQRDREARYYPRPTERETGSFSDKEWRTERQKEAERSRKRDTKSEGDSDEDRGKEMNSEAITKPGHKLYKSEGDSEADRRVDRVRDRCRDQETQRHKAMLRPREKDYREKGYCDKKEMRKDKRPDRDAYSNTPERGRYRNEKKVEERERWRRGNREPDRSKMEKSGQTTGEMISGVEIEKEQKRSVGENLEDRNRKNTFESEKEKLKGITDGEQEVLIAPREEEGGQFVVEETVTIKIKGRIMKMWLEPRSEKNTTLLEEEYRDRERARERYNQRYKESMKYEEDPARNNESKRKSTEDKYRTGEFTRDVERNEKTDKQEDMVHDKEAVEPEWQTEREIGVKNMEVDERGEESRIEQHVYSGIEEGSEGESEAEKDRIISTDDGFVTVSSGGDDAEEEDFEDCKDFWNGEVPTDIYGCSEATQGGEREPLRVFCVIGQTPIESQTKQNAYIDTASEEATDQHSDQNMDIQGVMIIEDANEAFEKIKHNKSDIERAMDDLTLSPNEENVEKTGDNNQGTDDITSQEGHMIPSKEGAEEEFAEPSETLDPCNDNGHETTVAHSEDALHRREMEATGNTEEHFDSDDTWSTCEERKRCSTAPHLTWAKNVVKEILGPNSEDTEHMKGSVTHIDIQINTQTETDREINISSEQEELIQIEEKQQEEIEKESDEKAILLDPRCIEQTVSSKREADKTVEGHVSKRKDSIENVILGSSSFRELGNEARKRRKGIRKTTEGTKEEEEDEDEEEGGVGRDRRTRIFNNSDAEEDNLCLTWSEGDLRKLGRTKKRNSKYFNSQLYQEYSEVVQNREILLTNYDTTSLSGENLTVRSSSTLNHSPKLSHRPLPALPQVHLHPHTLSLNNSLKSLNLPQQSINRPPSPRLSISASSPTLWRDLPGVRNSPEIVELTEDERRLQEVRFEVVTSEASYCRSLDIVVENFVMSKQLNAILSSQDKNWLFSRLNDVRAISHSFMSHLEENVERDMLHFTVCDIIIKYCPRFRNVYVPYLTNQSYQDKTYQRLMDESHEFRRVVEKLERNPVCQRLPLRSFLILPFQRITRLKLLVQNIVKRTAPKTKDEMQAIKAMKLLEKMILDSNESISQMKNIESLVTLNAKVDFECRTLPLISQSRRLVREGPVTELRDFSLKDREEERSVYMHLFNDYLLLSLRKEGGRFTVIDHAPVSELRAENCRFKLLSLQKNLFRLHMPQKALLLRTDTQADNLRWISALSRPYPEIDFSAVQETSQMQCIRAYVAQQPDELSLEKS